ncbi:MAG TPA: enoyl-CoA hydratase [Solirubrobacteraceae bacterium]|jgi:2-(1,2-epoxy-1,2-dihydrophenyl)acetyl-CoA isomerase|nr:enoyl-CoA hydratase [Solirubrobacteraceae bacterium]
MSLAMETVELNIAGGVAWITLSRPDALNAWTRELGEDLRSALDHAAETPEARAIVITGAGRAFSSGADLKAGARSESGKPDVLTPLREVYNPLILRVRTIPKPVIAAVNGPAVGIGFSLALAADLIVAAESAYFLLAFVNIGLGLDGGASAFLAARVGHTRAFELAYLGERLPAAQALAWGLVNRVVPDGELESAAGALAARLAAGPPGSYATIKQTINDHLYPRLEEEIDEEAVLQQERADSADFMEGVLAFMEKRPASFTGA